MSRLLPLALLLISCIACVHTQREVGGSSGDLESLKAISRDFLMAFEPQNVSPEDMEARALKHFDSGTDFNRIVDTKFYPSFDSLARTVKRWTAERKRGEWDRETHITITTERAVLLAADAGVVALIYREDGTDYTGRVWEMPTAAITYVFARRNGRWKIIYYHGSHGPRKYPEAKGQ